MSLNLQLIALTLPANTEFAGTPQADLDQKAQYLEISGDENFSGVNFGPTEPDEDSRGYPWFKTDESYNPIGWFAWNGSLWSPVPLVVPNGITANRPPTPLPGQLYFDTTINVQLIYERSQWRTLAGSPGDVKEVKAATLDDALEVNPGWASDSDSDGCVVAGAVTNGSGAGYGDTVGSDLTLLVHDNLPNFALPLKTGWDIFPGSFQNGTQSPGVQPITTGIDTTNATGNFAYDDPATGQLGVDVRQKTVYYWRIVKN